MKSIHLLGIKVFSTLFLLLLMMPANASSTVIEGSVLIEGGEPIRGGTLIVTELYSFRFYRMPKVRVLATAITDRDGYYRIELSDVEGEISIDLVRDRCSWYSTFATVDRDTIKDSKHLTIDLSAEAEFCECEDINNQ